VTAHVDAALLRNEPSQENPRRLGHFRPPLDLPAWRRSTLAFDDRRHRLVRGVLHLRPPLDAPAIDAVPPLDESFPPRKRSDASIDAPAVDASGLGLQTP